MYRLLVVDDEKYITDSIAGLFIDFDNEILEVYKAYLPTSALEIANDTKIDILITDIEMPYMNGLALSEKICERWPHCKVIVLSAYNDSDYLMKAIKQNSVDYVLKAEGDENIINAVKKAVNQHNEELGKQQILEQAKIENDKYKQFFKAKLVFDVLGCQNSIEDIKNYCCQYDINLDFNKSSLLYIANVTFQDTYDYFSFITRLPEIGLFIQDTFAELASVESGIYENNRLFFVIQSNGVFNDLKVTEAYINDILPQIQKKCLGNYNVLISFASINQEIETEKLFDSFTKLNNLINNSYVLNSTGIVKIGLNDEELFSGEENYLDTNLLPSEKSMLEMHLNNKQFDSFFEYLKIVFERIKEKCEDSNVLKNISYPLAEIILNYAQNKMMFDEANRKNLILCITNILGSSSLSELKKSIEVFLVFSKEQSEINENLEYDFIIKTIYDYVENNLSKDTSLTKIADKVHFNPSYLSRLFKKITGKTISEYVWDIKLLKAKQLMENENLNISKISSDLGFESRAYFTRFFKRMTGKTPVEYRRFLLIKDNE